MVEEINCSCSRYFFYPVDGGDRSSETSVYNKPTRLQIPEDGILLFSLFSLACMGGPSVIRKVKFYA
jgi:hypothetical protein